MAHADKMTRKSHRRLFLAVGVMILSPFQYGIDFGMIGGLQAMVPFLKIYGYECPRPKCPTGWNIQPGRQQLISSLMTLGAFISSGFAGVAAREFGRRQCLWAACFTCAVANIIMMATTSIGALYVGRLIIGFANGYFMTFAQLYIQESSTAELRGLFLTGFQFFTAFGTLIGNIVDWSTAKRPNRSAYLIPLGLIYIVPLILGTALIFIPESPRWLILQGRYDEGVKSLRWLRPDGCDVDAEASAIRDAIAREQEFAHSSRHAGRFGKGTLGLFVDMFATRTDRRRTGLAVAAVTLQAASGSMFLIAYKQYFLTMARVSNPFGMSNVLSCIGIVAIIANSLIIVRFGRRRVLLMTGLLVCGILQLIIACVYQKDPGSKSTGIVIVALSCLYMFSYNGMIATYAWLAGGEIPTQRLRSHTFGLAAAVGFAAAWLTTFTAPYFINPASLGWGARYGYIWFPSCVVAATWVFWCLPEVKGRTLEEIDEMFEAELPARKFAGYVCRTPESGSSGKAMDEEKRGSVEREKEVEVLAMRG